MMNGRENHFISAAQIQAARSVLNWSQEDLAEIARLSIATIRKLELGYISPRHTTTHFVREALENAGLEFIEPDGVRRRPDDIMIYQGRDGYVKFFEDNYNVVANKGGDIVAVYTSEIPYGFLGLEEFQKNYSDRMVAINHKAQVKNIITENRTPLWAPYIEYRTLSKHYVDSVPFHVYGDRYAIFMFDANPSPKIVVVQSRGVVEAFRHQFYSMWEKAAPMGIEREKDYFKKCVSQ